MSTTTQEPAADEQPLPPHGYPGRGEWAEEGHLFHVPAALRADYSQVEGEPPRLPSGWSLAVHDIVARYDGSISAEHGLGRLKTDEARRYKSPLEIRTMQAVRLAIDPHRIMNPAVLF